MLGLAPPMYHVSPQPSPVASRKLYACQVLVGTMTATRWAAADAARTTSGA